MSESKATFDLPITDPVHKDKDRLNWFDKKVLPLLNDKRDLPFMYLMLQMTLVVFPFAVALFIPGVFHWWLAAIYWAVVAFGFLDKFILCLHNTSHRTLFHKKYKWANRLIPWVYGPLFGETPDTYFAHHMGMHHPENNMEDDLSSTLRFQRDSVLGFGRYVGRFLTLGIYDLLSYHKRKGRGKLFRMALIGELAYYAAAIGLMFVNWRASVAVFVVPLIFTRFMMMAGNWAQHAFIDASQPSNCYLNSITCINSRYNRRAFNDGYHIGHHIKANRHWTEMPTDFLDTVEEYGRQDAVVFQGVDYFQVWLMLMLKQHRALAKRFVQLPGRERSEDEVVALLKSRLKPVVQSKAEASLSPATA
ncbi:MAG: fatty acid desaturase [Myxococcales bacterium]|nr:fatty acid desaturase [Myxococcales bacterium]